MPSPDDMDLSSYQHSDDNFLQGLPDFTGSQCGTPKQTTDGYYPSSSEFHIAAGLLDLGFCGTPWEQQQQQREHEQHLTPSNMALDEGLPYFGLLTPEDHQSRHHRNQHQEDIPLSTTNSSNSESFRYGIPLQDQTQSRFLQPIDYAPPPTISCTCVSALLDHLSTPTHATSSSFLASTSAALSTSKIIITSCYTTMECPKACFMRPSTVLVICEAIDRALVSLKLGGTSLWVSNQGFDNGTSPSPLSSPSLSSTSSGNVNDIMLPSLEMADEEHEPLRCGTLPIRGADRRAVVRVLLVKRILEIQGMLERLQDILLSALAVGGDAAAKKPLLALCANVVGEFAKKVAERLETVKLQPLECDG
ncbi:o-methyltransferase b [Pyrenophora seminiperda CCB06]|uniref:O-methyltransferase b n=1 Tax=Pyrenophora seminiperda CCB06 TaxID=1302712 RepID=A0A3M7M0C6_9PLEO|nr:o-methyltransferase b [Pyrenophora seminiperda CCB06]